MVMKYHPDKNKNTEELFRDVSEAYEYLKEPSLRSEHDKKLRALKSPVAPAKNRHGTDNSISIKITVEDIASESTLNITTKQMVHCSNCNGTGCTSKTLSFCVKCNGSGIDLVSAIVGPKKVCPTCHGYGDYPELCDCPACKGTGLITKNINRQIKLSRDFQPTIVIPGSGNWPIGEGLPGSLIVNLVVQKTNNFEIKGKNIKGELKISPAAAVLGDIVDLDVYGKFVKVIIPPGTKDGTIIEKENPGNKKGSLVFKIIIDIPQQISDAEKALYTQLLNLHKKPSLSSISPTV